MREKDFDAVALARIERAYAQKDASYIGGYLVENYSQTVKDAACRALGALCSEEGLKELLDALFGGELGRNTQAQIIKTLSLILTKEDLEQIRSFYDVCRNEQSMLLYSVLDRCVNY